MADALRLLAREARDLLSNKPGATMPDSPDFASRFGKSLHPTLLSKSITAAADDAAFVDAYTRWQLTSFNPVLAGMDDRQFLDFMASAPAMIPNPRARAATVGIFQRAGQEASIKPADLHRLKELASKLEVESAAAAILNKPAIGFRDWIQGQIGQTGHRPRLWLLERCAATILAGWPVGQIKSRVTIDFRESVGDGSFTPQQRQLVAQQARKLIGLERTMIDTILFTAAGGVEVSFERARIEDDDVERWIDRLGVGTPAP